MPADPEGGMVGEKIQAEWLFFSFEQCEVSLHWWVRLEQSEGEITDKYQRQRDPCEGVAVATVSTVRCGGGELLRRLWAGLT